MTTIPERIADDLAGAYARGLEAVTETFGANLAPHVEVVHLPAQPQDDTYDRATLLAAQAARVAEFARVMPDYREDAAVSTLGDEITVELATGGTLADGTAISIVGTDFLTVKNGEIVKMTSVFESDQTDVLVAALTRG